MARTRARRNHGSGGAYPYETRHGTRWEGRGPGGTPRKAGFETRADALEWVAEQTGRRPTSGGTVDDWLTAWLGLHAGTAAAATHDRDEQTVARYLRPRLGRHRLRDLTATHVKQFLADLKTAGVSDSERHRAGACLRKILNAAVPDLLAANPMTAGRVKLPHVTRREWVALTEDQLRHLVATADGRGMGPLVRVWADAGCRVLELLGLKWDDWHPESRTLTIRRAVCPLTGKLVPPKGKRVRRVVLGPETAAAIAGHHAATHLRGAADPVFPAPPKTRPSVGHQQRQNFYNRRWVPLLKAAKLTGLGITPRSMRHTCASLLLRRGASLRAVADRLGHRDPALTLRVYAHCMPGDQAALADLMDAVFRGG